MFSVALLHATIMIHCICVLVSRTCTQAPPCGPHVIGFSFCVKCTKLLILILNKIKQLIVISLIIYYFSTLMFTQLLRAVGFRKICHAGARYKNEYLQEDRECVCRTSCTGTRKSTSIAISSGDGPIHNVGLNVVAVHAGTISRCL